MSNVLVALLLALVLVPIARAQAPSPATLSQSHHTFGWRAQDFLLDGKPFRLRTGEMHFQRIPRAYWRDRLRMAKAMGLNTIGTYLFWNLLEPTPGQFDFSGNNDIGEFARIAQQEGLWVLLRPGPYACAEWDLGGLPSWLLKAPNIGLRSTDARFLTPALNYLKRVGAQVASLQITHGGPILMVQVENEYGSSGEDQTYLGAIRHGLLDAGFDANLYTVDGADVTLLKNGSLPGVLIGANLDGNPQQAFAALAELRPDQPRLNGEFYPGWFDHWGEPHSTHALAQDLPAISWMLENNVSFSLYMFHGGTSFGFMNGANYSDTQPYQPDTTSYDYDAPLDEAGRPTPKYFALRDLINAHLSPGEMLPTVPAPPHMIEIPTIQLNESASLESLLGIPVRSARPRSMEDLDQAYGFVLYRTRLPHPVKGTLNVEGVRDYALVSQRGKLLGTLDRRLGQTSLKLELAAEAPLEILVENMGRINYGKLSVISHENKGVLGKVSADGNELGDWENYTLPLDDLSALKFATEESEGIAFRRGTFDSVEAGDSFLDMRGWGKGHVWINGHHLGRFWKIGPQQSLYLPGTWLKARGNEIIVLDELPGTQRAVRGRRDAVFSTAQP